MTDQPSAPAPAPMHDSDPQSQANAALGIFGITGAGKTSLAITGIEESWEVYHKITHFYASDLGGWGTKLLSLIKLGIVRVWYIRNHVNPFETMELATQGYWPEVIADPNTGLAAPDVTLTPVRRVSWQLVCPNGHPVGVPYPLQPQALAAVHTCETCGQLTNAANALRVDRVVTRPGIFANVGHYVFDSMTQMNEFGLSELKGKSARGELPTSSSGGSALGSADALREGTLVIGTGSKAQYGFMQDRTPVWIANIRMIPDQVLPPTLTFGVEQSKGDEDSGGMAIYGPKISGNAATPRVPGWLGNCLFAERAPRYPVEVTDIGVVKMYHRLWTTTHVDPKDARAIPIVAKHRGEPFGIPPYLEDPYIDPSEKPEVAQAKAFTIFSLREFYRLLRAQQGVIEQRDAARYKDAPALTGAGPVADEVVQVISGASAGDQQPVIPTGRRRRGAVQSIAEVTGTGAAAPAQPPVTTASGASTEAAAVAGSTSAPAATTAPAEAVAVPAGRRRRPSVITDVAPQAIVVTPAEPEKPLHVQQLEASLAAAPPAASAPAQPPTPAPVAAASFSSAPPVVEAPQAAAPVPSTAPVNAVPLTTRRRPPRPPA